MAEKIIVRRVEEEMKTSYLSYAMSVIISRALPDVRDGLKPVHRRILYAMFRLGLLHNRPYRKSATVVGEVLGKYHPHGDMAIYGTLVRLAQDFSMSIPLVDGQGNFGSIDGDSPAAMRYTECRLMKISDEMLRDLDKNTVNFQNTFDDSQKEPIVLPSAFPNLLVNGSSGIAVGMATNIPPHNLKEVVDAVCHYIDNRECSVDDLMRYVKGPDFPTASIAFNLKGVAQAYHTGRGIFKIRGRVSIETFKDSQEAIVITEIPYQVNKAELVKKIAQLVKTEIIDGISEIRDETNKKGIRVVIELKRRANANIILNQIFKHTPLESSFSINMLAIVNGEPKTLSLKEMIVHYFNHRFEVATRRIRFELEQAEKRAHILEGLIKAVDHIEEVIRIIRSSQTVDFARKSLISRFEFTDIQAQAILEMRLSRLVALEIKKLQEELSELLKFITHCKDLLANPYKIDQLIKNELIEIGNAFSIPRRTELSREDIEGIDDEQLIEKSFMTVSITKSGYIRRTPTSAYKSQHRGGQGVRSVFSPEDIVTTLFVATTHHIVTFFTNKGKAYYLKVYEIPETSRTSKGSHVKMLLNLESDEHVEGYLTFEDFEKANQFIIITRNAVGKRCDIKSFVNAKKRGIQAIGLKEGDSVVGVVEVTDEDDIIICSRRGKGLRAKASSFRVMGRTATGVIAMRLGKGDEIVGVEKVDPSRTLLAVTAKGIGKRLQFDDFMSHGRGTQGQTYLNINESKTGEISGVKSIPEDHDALIITSSGSIIRTPARKISIYGRQAQGVKLVNVSKPDIVVDIAVALEEDETEEEGGEV